MKDKKNFTFYLSTATVDKLKKLAEKKGRSANYVLQTILDKLK